MHHILEVISFCAEACHIAQRSGAGRIELCDNPGEGGTTPSAGRIRHARETLQIPLFPIIRPRGGDFLYSEEEFEIMLQDVKTAKELGCDGVVLGILRTDGSIDRDRTSRLVDAAYPMDVTFHRAFDRVMDPMKALEDVVSTGCTRILTSGLKPTASEALDTIRRLHMAADGRIVVMPGSGVRSGNIREIVEATGVSELHCSAGTRAPSRMSYVSEDMRETLDHIVPDAAEIERMVSVLSGL